MSRALQQVGIGAILHGDMEQQARSQTLVRFANGSANVLVATDVAAPGLDIDDVHDLNFELPHRMESYLHRIGRTGRSGRDGGRYLASDREMSRLRT